MLTAEQIYLNLIYTHVAVSVYSDQIISKINQTMTLTKTL